MTPKQRRQARAFTQQCAVDQQAENQLFFLRLARTRGKPILPDRGNYFEADWLVEYDKNDRGPPASAPPCRRDSVTSLKPTLPDRNSKRRRAR
jgi:hypothetical protein